MSMWSAALLLFLVFEGSGQHLRVAEYHVHWRADVVGNPSRESGERCQLFCGARAALLVLEFGDVLGHRDDSRWVSVVVLDE